MSEYLAGQVYDISIEQIIVEERARKDYGDLQAFSENIKSTGGPLQPITVTPDLHLLAGGRRLAATTLAGFSTIRCLIRRIDGELDAKEVELYENLYRKDLDWKERAKLEREIYELKKRTEGWSQARMAEELGQSVGALNRHVQLGKAIERIPELENCKTEDDAWKAMKQLEEKVLLQEMNKRAEARAKAVLPEHVNKISSPEEKKKAKEQHYLRGAIKDYRIGDAMASMDEILSNEHHIKFHFAEVDPPYGIDLHEAVRTNTPGSSSNLDTYHEVEKSGYPAFIQGIAKRVYALMEKDSFAIFWFAPLHHQTVKEAAIAAGFTVNDLWGIWYKGPVGQAQQPARNLASSYEPFFIASKGAPAIAKQGRSNVFHFSPVPAAQKYHQTQKPLDLLTEIINTFCFPNYKILIPFLGSGVTLRAAYKTGHSGVGWDLEMDHKKHFLASIVDDIEEPKDDNDSVV